MSSNSIPENPAQPAAARRENWLNLPSEIAASLLAATTVIISLPPPNLPPWAVFIGWAGTFAAGGPKRDVLRKLWPVMPLGSFTAFLITLGFQASGSFLTGVGAIVAQMVIIFVLNGLMMSMARVFPSVFGFVPGMFFGFASYFATMFGGFGPIPHNPVAALVAVVIMNGLGPVYAWLNVKLSAPHGH